MPVKTKEEGCERLMALVEASMFVEASQSSDREPVRAASMPPMDQMNGPMAAKLLPALPPVRPHSVHAMHPGSSIYIGSSPRKYKLAYQNGVAEEVAAGSDVPAKLGHGVTRHFNNAVVLKNPSRLNSDQNNNTHPQQFRLASLTPAPNYRMKFNSDQYASDGSLGDFLDFSDIPDFDPDAGYHNASQAQLIEVQDQVQDLREGVEQLSDCNHNICNTISALNKRIYLIEKKLATQDASSDRAVVSREQIEGSSPSFRRAPDNRSRSPTPEHEAEADRVVTARERDDREPNGTASCNLSSKGKAKQKPANLRITIPENENAKPALPELQIKMPGDLTVVDPLAGVPTPATSGLLTAPLTASTASLTSSLSGTMSALTVPSPQDPITPQRLGPPTGLKKSGSGSNKRSIHNLDKMVPNAWAQLPEVPLTDTEVIVFFFNALARPIVSLRLYASNWGPKEICAVLNDHRMIDPPYLRNTCSVKCTTAIKRGRAEHGPNWEDNQRQLFQGASTTTATDLCRLSGADADAAPDFEIRSLCVGLKKYPDIGYYGGIFTKCVQHCEEHNLSYKLSNVHELAQELTTAHQKALLKSLPNPAEYAAAYESRFSAEPSAGATTAKATTDKNNNHVDPEANEEFL